MTAEVEKTIREATSSDFWGELYIRFKAGEPTAINLTRSIPLKKRETPYDRHQDRP